MFRCGTILHHGGGALAEPALFRFESAAGTATPGAPREETRTPLPFSERRGAHRNYKQRKPVM